MKFLPGNHTLKQTISVTNLTSLTLHGDSSSLPEVTSRIVCTWPAGFVFTGIAELHISALAFISCGHNYSAAVRIMSVQQSNISNCSFYNNGYVDMYDSRSRFYYHDQGGGALYVWDSNVILIRNIFQNNSAMNGGVFYIVGGTLTLTDNIFLNNSAKYGGVFYVRYSTINATGNTFQNNTAEVGGVFSVIYSTIKATGTFQNNTADVGGVLSITNSTINFVRNIFQKNLCTKLGGTIFARKDNIIEHNRAEYGGGIAVMNSQLELGNTTIKSCTARYGGGLCVLNTQITGSVTLTNNSAIVQLILWKWRWTAAFWRV